MMTTFKQKRKKMTEASASDCLLLATALIGRGRYFVFIMVTETCLFSRPFDLFVAKIISNTRFLFTST